MYRPRATGDLVHRPRVCEILDRHLDQAVTLVCAPAGFGKTTLVSDWLDHRSYPSAWLSLDERDGDVAVFLSYFVAAVRTLFPSAGADTLALLHAPVLPPLDLLVTALVNDLDRLADDPALPAGQRFVLVLDDYHLVREKAIHTLLGELFRHPPRALHLVVCARQDPPFALLTLRARGQLGEVRVRELRFTLDEVAAFMQQALGAPLDAGALATLVERTEGWGTGLRLAALTVSAGGDVTGPELAVDNRYVLDYLMNEVFARVPVATQAFLLKTAILDRLSGPLCDAVAGPADAEWDGRAYLEWLAAENLFTFSLDARGLWYRYHRIFQALLRRRLERQHSSEEIAELHRRACAWFAENGFIEEAIQHALEAGDEMTVVRLVEGHRHDAMNHERWRELERWLSLIPRGLIDSHAELLMLEAWILEKQWRYADLPEYLDRIETLMEQISSPEADRTRLCAEIDVLRSVVSYYTLDTPEHCFSYAKRALEKAPFACSFVRGTAWLYCGAGRQMTGDVQGAIDMLREGLQEDRIHRNAFSTRPSVGLGLIYWMAADLPNLVRAAVQMLQSARERGLTEATAWGHYLLGCALYQLNDLTGAEDEFADVVRQPYLAHAAPFSQSSFGLASVFLARGAYDKALEVVNSVAAYALNTRNRRVTSDAEAFRAYLAQQMGAAAEARRLTASFSPNTPPTPMTTFYVASVSHANVLLSAGTPADLAEADRELGRLHNLAASGHNTRYLIEVLALEALLQEARGNLDAGLAALQQAVALAEPGGVIRVFVDLGPKMAVLLRQLAARSGAREYLDRLLAAFGDVKEHQAPPNKPLPSQGGLIEPLSERELEVMALLSERLSNKEIAQELTISPTTVKRHTVNIYQKLSVGSRRDAVARALALGLLPTSQVTRRSFPPK